MQNSVIDPIVYLNENVQTITAWCVSIWRYFLGGGDDKKPYAIIGRHLPLNNSICQRNDNDSIFMCNFIIIDARER